MKEDTALPPSILGIKKEKEQSDGKVTGHWGSPLPQDVGVSAAQLLWWEKTLKVADLQGEFCKWLWNL